jgi:hypothetical protein
VSAAAVMPAYVRMPKPGMQCSLTGLSRAGLYRLCVPCRENGFAAPVVSKRVPGGGRVIDVESLLEFLDNLPADNAGATKPNYESIH